VTSPFGGLRPAGVPRRGLILLGLVVAFYFIARASGAGWVVVLLCGEAPVLLLAAVWPVITLSRVGVEVTANQRDATAGSPAVFSLSVRRAGSGVRMRLIIGDRPSGWVAASGTNHGEMTAIPPGRGIVTSIAAQMDGAGPLGLIPWVRRMELTLPVPMEVGPIPTPVTSDDLTGLRTDADEASAMGVGHDTIRGVRPYAFGDPIRLVHWPATARWGEMMVKELEGPEAPEVVIVVDLRGDAERAEVAASLAAGMARAGLRAGLSVTLLTAERTGPRSAPVTSPTLLGRRLARTVTDASPPSYQGAGRVLRVTAT
jgi:uncharacterized protein (DUF58 family)